LDYMIGRVRRRLPQIQQSATDVQVPQRNIDERYPSMKLRHVVLFGFGKAHSSAAIAEVIRRFAELKALVPGIDDFEWGENSSPEGLDHGHSHVFLLTFASARARDAYLVHPDHAAFANWVQPFVSAVTVLDYWVEIKTPGVLGDLRSPSVP
jgi:hypothetical protein